jgi:CBS domain-containing protein
MRFITCRFCDHDNPIGGDACENCGAEFSEGLPASPDAFEGRLLGTPLGALAGSSPRWLPPEASALAAVTRMKADGVDYVLVGDGRRLAGIFTDRDAMLKLPGRPGGGPALGEVMTPDPVVVRAVDTVALGIHAMAVAGVRHLPLLAGAEVTAVVTAREIFRHLATRLDEPSATVQAAPSSGAAPARGEAGAAGLGG